MMLDSLIIPVERRLPYKGTPESVRARRKVSRAKAVNTARTNLIALLASSPCVICGLIDPLVMEFNHIDPKTKHRNVSDMICDGYSWKTIKKEIDKCEIMCANCHRRHTAKQYAWYKN